MAKGKLFGSRLKKKNATEKKKKKGPKKKKGNANDVDDYEKTSVWEDPKAPGEEEAPKKRKRLESQFEQDKLTRGKERAAKKQRVQTGYDITREQKIAKKRQKLANVNERNKRMGQLYDSTPRKHALSKKERKQAKWEAANAAAAAAARAAAGSESDPESAEEKVDSESDDDAGGAVAKSYKSMMASLATKGSTLAKLLARRRREQEGSASEEEESEEDDEFGSGSEQEMEMTKAEMKAYMKKHGDKFEIVGGGDSDGEEDSEGGDEEGAEEEDAAEGDEEEVEEEGEGEEDEGSDEDEDAPAAAQGAENVYKTHFENELSVQELLAAGAGAAMPYKKIDAECADELGLAVTYATGPLGEAPPAEWDRAAVPQSVEPQLLRAWSRSQPRREKDALPRRAGEDESDEDDEDDEDVVAAAKAAEAVDPEFTPLQRAVLPAVRGYHDVMLTAEDTEQTVEVREMVALHVLDHVLKHRSIITKNTARVRKVSDAQQAEFEAQRERAEALRGTKKKDRKRILAEQAAEAKAKAEAEAKGQAKGKGGAAGEGEGEEGGSGEDDDEEDEEEEGDEEGDEEEGEEEEGKKPGVVLNLLDAEEDGELPGTRDQGFTQATVLVLLPYMSMAHQFVHLLARLLPQGMSVSNRDRFEDEYGEMAGQGGEDDSEDEDGAKVDKWAEAHRAACRSRAGNAQVNSVDSKGRARPADWQEVFSGNNDDDFRLGISWTRKNLRLFSDFDAADIIVASPLGLRRTMGDETEKHFHADFLSSIELMVVDRADVSLMQVM
jgi:hypothetical protein